MRTSVQLILLLAVMFQAALVGVVLVKRLWKRFPAFTAYAIVNFIEGISSYATFSQSSLYFFVYSIGESVTIALGLAIVYELFSQLFWRHQALRKIAAVIMQVCAGVLILLAGAVLYTHSPIGKHEITNALMIVEEAARIIELGCIVFLFVFSGVFGLHWRQWMFGIALGLGILVAAKLLVITMLPYSSRTMARFWFMVSGVSYDLSFCVWLGYLMIPERAPDTADLPQHSQLEQWNQAILELIHQ